MCDYCSSYIPYNNIDKNIMSNTTIKTIVKFINTYLKDFRIHIVLLGGEPLLYPNINEILDILRAIKNLMNIEIYTNASLLFQSIIKNHNKIVYTLSYHIDMLLRNNQTQYITNFINNVQFLNQSNIVYSIEILSQENNHSGLKDKYIKSVLDIVANNSAKFIKIRPTNKYHKEEKQYIITNKKYNKPVYYCRAITITRLIHAKYPNNIYIYIYVISMFFRNFT